MPASMRPIRDEHRALQSEIMALRTTADQVGTVAIDELSTLIDARVRFLRDDLKPHAEVEDDVVYPIVAQLLGSTGAVDTMRRDHTEIVRLAEELQRARERLMLGALDEQGRNDLRTLLYGLFAVVSLHFTKEEDVYLPLLERGLSEAEAAAMFRDMEHLHHRLTVEA